MSGQGPGCVKTRRCGEQIEWTFRQITIRVMRILKRGQFRSIRERSFFSFSSFRGFHTAWVISLGSDRGRGPVYVRIPPIASEFCAPQRKTPSAKRRLMQCSKTGCYSITSSAVASRVTGTSRPSAPAVFTLMTSSNLVGCWTGRSAGLSPLRIRST